MERLITAGGAIAQKGKDTQQLSLRPNDNLEANPSIPGHNWISFKPILMSLTEQPDDGRNADHSLHPSCWSYGAMIQYHTASL